MHFYAIRRTERNGVVSNSVTAFENERLRDFFVGNTDYEPCLAAAGRGVRRCDGKHGCAFFDMSNTEYWDGEWADLYDESIRLGLWQ